MIKRLYFDIETSPCIGWFWKPGYKLNLTYDNVYEHAKIICICCKWSGQDKIYSLKWTKSQDDKQMLEDFIAVMNQADEIVGHNADRFDTKWIRTRAVFHDIDMPPDYKSIDTLKQARSLLNLPSNKLDSIGKYYNLGQKLENEKGLWEKVCRYNNQSALNRMIKYCKQDVVLLEQWFDKLNKYIKPKSSIASHRANCPECNSSEFKSNGFRISPALGRVIRAMCQNCGKNYQIPCK